MKTELRKKLNQPLTVGNCSIDKRLFLAPMAGLGNVAFRELVESYGGYGLLFTGMCSARVVPRENRYLSHAFKWRDAELSRLVCQLFGADPEDMAMAAARVEQEGFMGVDLNFGCSVAAICKRNCGAALLKDPDLAVKIVERVRKAIGIPLFVKYRTGWEDDPELAMSLAKRFEDAGADALVFHPRVAPDRRSRAPKWEYISMVKEAVGLPVLGNGNLFDGDDCSRMLSMTGCDGLSLGRIAVARPWIFSVLADGFSPDETIYKECALKMLSLLENNYDSVNCLKLYKKFVVYFSANFSFGHSIFTRLCKAETIDAARDNILSVLDTPPKVVSRPNMNMFV